MTKNKSLNHIPKTHTIIKNAAEEIFHIAYPGRDKESKKTRTREIEQWLVEGSYFGIENPAELAKAWQEYCKETDY